MKSHLFAKLFLFLVGGILIQLFMHVPMKSETHDNGVFNIFLIVNIFHDTGTNLLAQPILNISKNQPPTQSPYFSKAKYKKNKLGTGHDWPSV